MHLFKFRYVPTQTLEENQPELPLTWTGVFEIAISARDYTTHDGHLYQVVSRRPLSFFESARGRTPDQHGLSAYCSVRWVHKLQDRPIADDEAELLNALDAYL